MKQQPYQLDLPRARTVLDAIQEVCQPRFPRGGRPQSNAHAGVADSVAISRGKHNLKFGGQWRNSPVANEASNLPRGQTRRAAQAA